MAEDERRRTGFERDLREFVLKIVIGFCVGIVLYMVLPGIGSFWVPVGLGILGVFLLASVIRGSSRHAD